MKTSTIVIIVLSVALAIVSYIAFKSEPVSYDKAFIEKRMKDLEAENKTLTEGIAKDKKEKAVFVSQIDSLQNFKPKVIIKYYEKSQKIDHAFSNDVVNEYKNIFAGSNIK